MDWVWQFGSNNTCHSGITTHDKRMGNWEAREWSRRKQKPGGLSTANKKWREKGSPLPLISACFPGEERRWKELRDEEYLRSNGGHYRCAPNIWFFSQPHTRIHFPTSFKVRCDHVTEYHQCNVSRRDKCFFWTLLSSPGWSDHYFLKNYLHFGRLERNVKNEMTCVKGLCLWVSVHCLKHFL